MLAQERLHQLIEYAFASSLRDGLDLGQLLLAVTDLKKRGGCIVTELRNGRGVLGVVGFEFVQSLSQGIRDISFFGVRPRPFRNGFRRPPPLASTPMAFPI